MRSDRVSLVRSGIAVAWLLAGVPTAAHADWLASGYFGDLWTRPSQVTLTLPALQTAIELDGVRYRGESFRSPQYYGYRVSWIPDAHPWIGVEFEVVHAKVFARTEEAVPTRGTIRGVPVNTVQPISLVAQRLVMSHGLNFLFFNLAVRRGIGEPDARGVRRLALVFRGGAGPTVPHIESTVDHVNLEQYEGGGPAVQGTAGVELRVWRRLGVLGEYKYTRATPHVAVAGGEAVIPARSHHLVTGLTARF